VQRVLIPLLLGQVLALLVMQDTILVWVLLVVRFALQGITLRLVLQLVQLVLLVIILLLQGVLAVLPVHRVILTQMLVLLNVTCVQLDTTVLQVQLHAVSVLPVLIVLEHLPLVRIVLGGHMLLLQGPLCVFLVLLVVIVLRVLLCVHLVLLDHTQALQVLVRVRLALVGHMLLLERHPARVV